MAVPDKEWREFANRMEDRSERMIILTSSLLEKYEQVDRKLEILFEKIDPALLKMAVLEDREAKRTFRDNTAFGAMIVTLIGAAVTGVMTILGWKK